MNIGKKHICPVEHSGSLDNKFRRLLQNPGKILAPHIKEGMTVLDLGCGPGFFTTEMAHLVGKSGGVIASDLQEGMLQKLKEKIQGTELEERITLHQCGEDGINLSEKVDFILAFYMLHEVPIQEAYLREISSLLKPNGRVLIVEPPFHVSKSAFEEIIRKAQEAGLSIAGRPKMLISKAILLKPD